MFRPVTELNPTSCDLSSVKHSPQTHHNTATNRDKHWPLQLCKRSSRPPSKTAVTYTDPQPSSIHRAPGRVQVTHTHTQLSPRRPQHSPINTRGRLQLQPLSRGGTSSGHVGSGSGGVGNVREEETGSCRVRLHGRSQGSESACRQAQHSSQGKARFRRRWLQAGACQSPGQLA